MKNLKLLWRPSWILEWNNFSSSESPMPPTKFQLNPTFLSLSHFDASHKVSAQYDLWWPS